MQLLEKRIDRGGGAEQVVESLLLDAAHQFHEQRVGFVLVFDERVLLALGAQINSFAQGIHVVEVGLPLFVDGHQHHATFLLFEDFSGQIGCAQFIRFFDPDDQHGGDLIRCFRGLQILQGDAHRQVALNPVIQFRQVG